MKVRVTMCLSPAGPAGEPLPREGQIALPAPPMSALDDPGAVLEESGELIAAIQSGMCTQDQLRPLAGLVQGAVEAGSSRRSLFKSVGFGLLDAAAAAAVLGGPD